LTLHTARGDTSAMSNELNEANARWWRRLHKEWVQVA
jgi:hypothetical protein